MLNLEGNSLAGAIPGSFGDLPALEALNLAHNSLRGGCAALYVLSSTTISKLIMFLLLQGAFRRAWGACTCCPAWTSLTTSSPAACPPRSETWPR